MLIMLKNKVEKRNINKVYKLQMIIILLLMCARNIITQIA